MNFSKWQNEFCDIPGFDASKGERILRALQKLWEKIQYLEQSRISEKKIRSEASSSSTDEDLTLTDVQYKLLLLQLQYVRSLLRKKIDSQNETSQARTNEDVQKYTFPTTDRNIIRADESHPDIVNKPFSAEVQIVNSSIAGLNSPSLEEKSKNVQVLSDNLQFPRLRHSTEESTTMYQKTLPGSSKPHYHLKLDDVPFILGASSTASHSVVANVQNIIAMMKSHNKALCGPKPVSKSSVAHSTDFVEKTFAGENSQDVTKMMNDLSRDLCALNAKQKKLVDIIDATQIKKHDPGLNLAKITQSLENKISSHVENDGSKTQRSHSESEVKLHAEVKKVPKVKEKDFIKQNMHPKQSACNVKWQPSNLSIMDRRKLLRSLQNFKKNLSEEDISWD